MNDKQFSIAGVVIVLIAAVFCLSIWSDNPAITHVVSLLTVGLGIVVTLYRLGVNTEKTEQIERNTNGILDARIRDTYTAGFKEGRKAGWLEAKHDDAKKPGDDKPPTDQWKRE